MSWKVKRYMSDEVDTNWDNDITVRLELTRRNLKVISNKLSNSYSLPHCEYFHGENYFPCALFCVQCRWNSLGSNFVYVGFCPATLCVLMGKYPTSQNFDSNNVSNLVSKVRFNPLWLNICREKCHSRYFMSTTYPVQWMSIWWNFLCFRPPSYRTTQMKKASEQFTRGQVLCFVFFRNYEIS